MQTTIRRTAKTENKTGAIMKKGLKGSEELERRSRSSRGCRYMAVDVEMRSDVK